MTISYGCPTPSPPQVFILCFLLVSVTRFSTLAHSCCAGGEGAPPSHSSCASNPGMGTQHMPHVRSMRRETGNFAHDVWGRNFLSLFWKPLEGGHLKVGGERRQMEPSKTLRAPVCPQGLRMKATAGFREERWKSVSLEFPSLLSHRLQRHLRPALPLQ